MWAEVCKIKAQALAQFFFANQQRIDGIIQGEGVKGDMSQIIEKFEKIESNIYDQMSAEMKNALVQ